MYSQQRGFTLIELLIVVLLISILISITVMVPRNNNDNKKIQEEVTRLAFLFNAASEQALLSGNEIGFSSYENQYCWWEWDNLKEKWFSMTKRQWQCYNLPENLQLLVQSNDAYASANPKEGPVVVFHTDGLTSPVNLTFSTNNANTEPVVLVTDGVSPLDEQ